MIRMAELAKDENALQMGRLLLSGDALVYHYTTAAAAENILRDGVLSSARYKYANPNTNLERRTWFSSAQCFTVFADWGVGPPWGEAWVKDPTNKKVWRWSPWEVATELETELWRFGVKYHTVAWCFESFIPATPRLSCFPEHQVRYACQYEFHFATNDPVSKEKWVAVEKYEQRTDLWEAANEQLLVA